MTPISFIKAIEQFFLKPDTPIQLKKFEELVPSSDIPREITIDNLQAVSARLLNTLNKTNIQIRAGTISLVDLLMLRTQFYEARQRLVALEKKEQQDVIDLKNSTKWFERSKVGRLFAHSDSGYLLDQEAAEAAEATSTKLQFFEKLEEFESIINFQIINTGERSSPDFKELVTQWRTVSQLEKNARITADYLNAAFFKLSTDHTTTDSENYMVFAVNQLKEQRNILTPWFDRLTVEVEDTINRARVAIKI